VGHRRERPAGDPPADARAPPSPDEVRAQLARILASPEFAVPERGRTFLRYVVEETLAGRTDRLKGHTIATVPVPARAAAKPPGSS
jgi:adenylate cyclase